MVFRKVKTLAEEDWLDDTVAWVERSRKMAKEKELAEKRVSRVGTMGEGGGLFVCISHAVILYSVFNWFLYFLSFPIGQASAGDG